MKSYKDVFEELATTGDAGFETGEEIGDGDARVPSGTADIQKRTQPLKGVGSESPDPSGP